MNVAMENDASAINKVSMQLIGIVNKLIDERLSNVVAGSIKSSLANILGFLNVSESERAVLLMVKEHDEPTFIHSVNVMVYTLAIANELRLPSKEHFHLGMAALLHDVGKCNVLPEILNKPGKLNDIEYRLIKGHSEHGFSVMNRFKNITDTVRICAIQHHERLDGTGYPFGLKNKQIHPYAKIIAVADVFDAITSDRPYRKGMDMESACAVLNRAAKSELDKRSVDALLRLL